VKYISEFRNPEVARALVERIRRRSRKPARLMEFCGGHTVAIFRHGLRELLPANIEMVSGPGCPVCVTADSELDRAIGVASIPDVITTTFGDMFKVPGSRSSLQDARAAGKDVRMVYSPLDALATARENPSKKVVFLGIGFETTAPGVAASILQASREGLANYSVLCLHKTCPPALRAILESGDVNLQGLICPGHVSAVTGSQAWEPIAKDYWLPCVVAGFEPLDILQSVAMLVHQVEDGISTCEIAYRRGVTKEGNRTARELMDKVFRVADGEWRGMGTIPGSGLAIRDEFSRFDAARIFEISVEESTAHKGCMCGEVLRGVKTPHDCPLFATSCTPETPIGPCMVSSEGTCGAYFRFAGSRT